MDTLRTLSSALLRASSLRKLPSSASPLLGVVASGLFLALFPGPAAATLYGYCFGCVPNGSGTHIMTASNPPSDFGFTTSLVPQSGDLFIDVLVPNVLTNYGPGIDPSTLSLVLTGTLSGTATLFSSSAWTSGMLDSYLKISASPSNPIGAFLPSTLSYAPLATGFFVYQADLGTTALQGPSDPRLSPVENISSDFRYGQLPLGSYIVGFLKTGTTTQATANNGAIFVPEPASLLLLGTGLLGLGVSRRRRHG